MITSFAVLILVVVEDGIGDKHKQRKVYKLFGLNPCCSGRWYRSCTAPASYARRLRRLNPCCSGRWYRSVKSLQTLQSNPHVLILVVVEDGIGEDETCHL